MATFSISVPGSLGDVSDMQGAVTILLQIRVIVVDNVMRCEIILATLNPPPSIPLERMAPRCDASDATRCKHATDLEKIAPESSTGAAQRGASCPPIHRPCCHHRLSNICPSAALPSSRPPRCAVPPTLHPSCPCFHLFTNSPLLLLRIPLLISRLW